MDLNQVILAVKNLLIETLSLDLALEDISDDFLLLGNLPEFDSMAIVSVITSLEEEFGFITQDDELEADVFESVSSLAKFVKDKLAQ
jgi:acyl carrier protein